MLEPNFQVGILPETKNEEPRKCGALNAYLTPDRYQPITSASVLGRF
jgi:hypothetical protein